MKSLTLIVAALMLLLPNGIRSQAAVAIGEIVPTIAVTDWIENVPEDTTLNKKVVVIDFWATWCGPCIKAVPHFNELVETFRQDDRVIFLSMTYERPIKIRRTLERVDFQSVVVTDQENRTQETLGVTGLPYTLVIDADGRLAWKGHPESLNEATIRDVIDRQPVADPEPDAEEETVDLDQKNLGWKELIAAVKDSTITEDFKLIPVDEEGGLQVTYLPVFLYQSGTDIPSILSSFLEVPKYRVTLPSELEGVRFNLVYLNKEIESEAAAWEYIIDRISREYGFTIQKTERVVEGFTVEVKDSSRLTPSTSAQGGVSDAGDKIVFTAQPVSRMLFRMEERLKVALFDRTDLDGIYDFIIASSSPEQMRKSLKDYGLKVKKVKMKKTFVEISLPE